MQPAVDRWGAFFGVAVVASALGAGTAGIAQGPSTGTIALETAIDQYRFDAGSGRLVSLRAKRAPDVELLASSPEHPVFVLKYLGNDRQPRWCDSRGAKRVSIAETRQGDGKQLTLSFAGVAGLDLDVTLTVRAATSDRFSRWNIAVRNGAGLRIVDVQYPFVVVPSRPDAAVLLPAFAGCLRTGAMLDHLEVDDPRTWHLIDHYPGAMFAQFQAWYAPQGGIYMACEDTEGNVKVLKTVRRTPGIRLGIAHAGDWPAQGQRTLEYDVVLSSFQGDWYDAADLYRDWSLRQKWATPLSKRTDVASWLFDSPAYITVRPQGYLDDGPAPAVKEFLPYEKCIPLLEGIARRIEAPLTVVLMGWEHGGSWIYPQCFPPIGGEQSIARFTAMARERGWHVGSFCNGTRWVTKHVCGYDGQKYFEQNRGQRTVCRTQDGQLWGDDWGWRYSYLCCMAQQDTQRIANDFVKRLIGWGMESIQFFDQNCNATTFPCFAEDHGHPSVPGKWMAGAMAEMARAFRQSAAEARQPGVIYSVESPCNEYCLPLFQECDVRVSPPSSGAPDFAPVYHYLFHECIVMQGMMSTGPEPYALPIRNAWNGVLGEIPGAVMTGDGTLLNRETFNWALWEPKVGNNDDALEMIRTVTAMRRGPGRDFLVFGRMQHPARVSGIDVVKWQKDGRAYAVPTVAHAAWQAPDGRYGIVLANWTTESRSLTISEKRLTHSATVHWCGKRCGHSNLEAQTGGFHITVPPLGCTLITPRGPAQ